MISDKHKEFAEEYALTTDVVKSYQKAYPKAKAKSASELGRNLLDKMEIREYVDRRKAELRNEPIKEHQNKTKAVLLSRDEAIEMLSNVAKTQYVNIVASVQPATPSQITAFVSIIDRLAKSEGWDKPSKVAQTDTEGNDIPLFIQMVKKGVKIRYNEN